MAKVGDLVIQIDTKPFDDFAKAVKDLEPHITKIVAPLGTMHAFSMGLNITNEGISDFEEAVAILKANYPDWTIELNLLEPANMPIELRLQYQYQFWMTPLWFIQDKWYEWRNR